MVNNTQGSNAINVSTQQPQQSNILSKFSSQTVFWYKMDIDFTLMLANFELITKKKHQPIYCNILDIVVIGYICAQLLLVFIVSINGAVYVRRQIPPTQGSKPTSLIIFQHGMEITRTN